MIDDDRPWRRMWYDSDYEEGVYNRPSRERSRGHRIFTVGRSEIPATPLADYLPPVVPEPTTPLQPAAAPEPVALALRLMTDDGLVLPDVAVQIREGEDWIDKRTDPAGMLALERPEGVHDLRLGEPPLALPPVPPNHVTIARHVTLERGRTEPFALSTIPLGSPPKIVAVRRPAFTEILIDGYAMGSVVMRWGGTRQRLGPDGLPVVGTCRAALRSALWLARGHCAFVVGHADPQGADVTNATVAIHRARSVFLYAAGDLDGWAEHAAGLGTDLDRACAAVACARIVGEPPPGLDDAQAVRRTLDSARALAGVPPGNDAAGDFRAAAALYDVDLSRILRTDLAGLASLRALVFWIGSGHGELGERFPRPPAELDLASWTGLPYQLACRRSAIVVCKGLDALALKEGDVEELYDGTFHRTTIDTPVEYRVKIAVLDAKGDPIPRGRAWIEADTGVVMHTANAEGIVTFDALLGERIEVVLASQPDGSGTLVGGGTQR